MKTVILILLLAFGVLAWALPTYEILAVAIILFIVGLAMIIKGGDVFVDGAVNIAKALKIPTFIIGATIVSLATTLPEMLVSVFAAAEGAVDMSVGNAVGSVTANTAMILAISMVASTIICDRKNNLLPILLLILATATVTIGCLGGSLNVIASIALAVIFVVFMVNNALMAKRQGKELKSEDDQPVDKKHLLKNVLFFVIGTFALAGGSRFLVNYGSYIAGYFGVSELIISVTIIAIGTSLPELVTTITALVKKETNLSVGNIIGANVIDITLILPICSLISGQQLPINTRSVFIDLPVCFVISLVAFLPLLFRQKSSKFQGIAMLTAYVAYIVVLVLCEVGVIVF